MNNILDDFYNEINNNDTHASNNNSSDNCDYNNICLISGEKLNNTTITLACNHKFNYFYIFNEIINQKNNKNRYSKLLKINEIKCPYCRNIQKKILPYKDIKDCDKKIYGVNYPKKYAMKNNQCCYIFRRGANKGKQCTKESVDMYCREHLKYKSDPKYNPSTSLTIKP